MLLHNWFSLHSIWTYTCNCHHHKDMIFDFDSLYECCVSLFTRFYMPLDYSLVMNSLSIYLCYKDWNQYVALAWLYHQIKVYHSGEV